MALCRCKNHRPPEKYIQSASPLGYPLTSSVCGRPTCMEPGLIWLTKDEFEQYKAGSRIFKFDSAVTKVKVE